MNMKTLHRLIPAINLWLVLCVALCSITNTLAASSKCHFPAIFNFGDSNSDTGGLSAAFGQAGPPHGESYFHHPAGRYCNDRLIIDFIAEKLGLPNLNAYLDAVGSNFRHGANFATAGSTIRPQNTTLHQIGGFSPFSLDVHFNQFNDFQRRSQFFRNKGGVYKTLLPKAEDFSRALYTFDIGQNDLAAGFFHKVSTDLVRAHVPDVLAQFKNIIKDLHPVEANAVDKAGCATPYNEVAQFFNRELKAAVVQLGKKLPLAAITYVDVYSVKYSLISQGKKHGFEEPLRACCGYGGKYNYNLHIECGGKVNINGNEVLVGKPCNDPSIWINWDGAHFTQATNK